jgi:response regulator RpfG family c-di-GMP phosphodiesterase
LRTSRKEFDMADVRPRILCVDDEENVLEGLTRTLRSLYSVETAVGGTKGLEVLKSKGPFAVILSDLRMPNMTGVEFLYHARRFAPDTVRVLLTGQGDFEAAIGAVNDGNIFRFLTKPCPSGVLVNALIASAKQYQLVTTQRLLLEQTLRGSIKALTDILAHVNPAAFGRATRIQRSVSEMMVHFEIEERWPVEVAAMLSQIGYVTLPADTQEKIYNREPLTSAEQAVVDRVPKVVEQLLGNIPRLELVREILRLYTRQFAGDNQPKGDASGETLPWGARALKLALDYDLLESENNPIRQPFDILRSRVGWYDPVILEAFAELQGSSKQGLRVRELSLAEVTAGMLFAEDVKSSKGVLLISRGQEVTPGLLERVRNFSFEQGVREPLRMIERQGASAAPEKVLSPIPG